MKLDNEIEGLKIANKSMEDYIDEFKEKHNKLVKHYEKTIKEILDGSDIAEAKIREKAKKRMEKLDIIIKQQQGIINNLRLEKKKWKRDWYAGAYNRYKKEIEKLKQRLINVKKKLYFEEKATKHLIKLYNQEKKK